MRADKLQDAIAGLAALQDYLRTIPATSAPAKPQAADYVLIPKAAEITGYTRRAIEAKIEKGIWLEGREWIKAPDGHRMISMAGYRRWVERGR